MQWFAMFWLLNVMLILFSSAVGTVLGIMWLDFKKTQINAQILILAGMLLGGFYVKEQNLPVFVAWVKWLSVVRYPYVLSLKIIFTDDIEFSCATPSEYEVCQTQGHIKGTDVLKF
eukprot:UN24558